MRRIVLLTALAAMMAAAMALSGVAQAAPVGGKADAKCLAEANKTLQPGFKPSDYNFVGGTEGPDLDTFTPTAGPDVFCGFGGDDEIGTLAAGDIFLGGAGNDGVSTNSGTFYGGDGNDGVGTNDGTFYGEEGNDAVDANDGIFYGGLGDDSVHNNTEGTFYGGDGNDFAFINNATFFGEEGNDRVENNSPVGTFNGGPGIDTVDFGEPPVDGPSGT